MNSLLALCCWVLLLLLSFNHQINYYGRSTSSSGENRNSQCHRERFGDENISKRRSSSDITSVFFSSSSSRSRSFSESCVRSEKNRRSVPSPSAASKAKWGFGVLWVDAESTSSNKILRDSHLSSHPPLPPTLPDSQQPRSHPRAFEAEAAASLSADKFVNTNYTESGEQVEEGATVAVVAVIASCAVGLLFFCWCRIFCQRTRSDDAYFESDDEEGSEEGFEKSGDVVGAAKACTPGPTPQANGHAPPQTAADTQDAIPRLVEDPSSTPQRSNPLLISKTSSILDLSGRENNGITSGEDDSIEADDTTPHSRDAAELSSSEGLSSPAVGIPLRSFEGTTTPPTGRSPLERLGAQVAIRNSKPFTTATTTGRGQGHHYSHHNDNNLAASLLGNAEEAHPPYMLKSPGLLTVHQPEGEATHVLGLGGVVAGGGENSVNFGGYIPPTRPAGLGFSPTAASSPSDTLTPQAARRQAGSTATGPSNGVNPLSGETPLISAVSTPSRQESHHPAAAAAAVGGSFSSLGVSKNPKLLVVTKTLALDDPDL